MWSYSKCIFYTIFLVVTRSHTQDDDNLYSSLLQNDSNAIYERTDFDGDVGATNPTSVDDNFSNSDEMKADSTTETSSVSTTYTTSVSQTESIPKANETDDTKYKIKEICAYFKYVGPINLNKMVDLWQTAYYQASQKVPCFKMFIRKLTMKEKQFYKQKYGDFDDAVEWEDCNLEIKSSLEIKKHFLQGCERGHGVLENIILTEKNNDTSNYILKPESPDQWLVVKNLLLMRDCDTGDVIVFSRAPHKPRKEIIIEALKLFGENSTEGKFICGDQPPIRKNTIEVEDATEDTI
ncbi:unnamed protein product [Parnassius mnemosyne]|uniref:Uncharacterized protein n=1 Tax=Parnassius mnemosyne TaxID=213953 RepID=A0AAV1K9R3_9NEOP